MGLYLPDYLRVRHLAGPQDPSMGEHLSLLLLEYLGVLLSA